MGSISISPPSPLHLPTSHPPPLFSLRSSFSFFHPPFPSPPRPIVLRSAAGVQGGGVESQGAEDSSLLRRPVVSPAPLPVYDDEGDGEVVDNLGGDEVEERKAGGRGSRRQRMDPELVEWEDKIFEDTVPLVGFVRMLLHSGKYKSGDRLSPEHEKAVLERLLAHHPQYEKKIGCGIDFITIGYHPDFESSRCLFLVRKDGELVDFSYWKCIKSLIKKKYPLYADSFILRHFGRRRNSE